MRIIEPDMLRRLCAEPEPSTEGTWFMVSLEDLRAAGYTHIEFHVPDEAVRPDDARLYACEETR